jgi:hypothetical protein
MKQTVLMLHFGSTRPENLEAGSTPRSSSTAYLIERTIGKLLLLTTKNEKQTNRQQIKPFSSVASCNEDTISVRVA